MARGVQIESLWNGLRDLSGNPLNQGRVYAYLPGTVTPTTLYTNYALTSPATDNNGRLVLDAHGQALVFASGSVKLKVYDGTDRLLYTYDNLQYFIDNYPLNTFVDATDYGSSMDDVTIAAAIAAIAGASRTLFLKPGTWTIANNLTVPSNINLWPARGAVLTVSASKTLTLNGSFQSGIYNVFAGSGTVMFGQGTIQEAYPQWWSADGAGIQAAINAFDTIRIPPGSYTLSSELLISSDYKSIVCDRVALVANTVGMSLVHWAGNRGKMNGQCVLNANGLANVSGLRVTPVSESSTTVYQTQSLNSFRGLQFTDCQENIVLKCGPKVGANISVCQLNTFEDIAIGHSSSGAIRAILMLDGPNVGSDAPSYNRFVNIGISSPTNFINTGLQIDSGYSNEFENVFFQGAQVGTTPNNPPVGVLIAASGTYSGANSNNTFIASSFANNTTDMTNNAPSTQVVGGNLPLFTFTLNTGNVTNSASVSSVSSKYCYGTGFIEWVASFTFQASVAGTLISITLPVLPNAAMYKTPTMHFPVIIIGASLVAVPADASFDATYQQINIPAPSGNWDAAAANNKVFINLRYHV